MFTNAGMVQFKNVFTGSSRSVPIAAPPRRRNACAPAASTTISTMSATPRAITPSSRCSAISRSATISRNAIELAWTLVTKDYGLPKDKLTVTVYSRGRRGASACGRRSPAFPTTASSASPTSDNFWAMGDTGPCGPCSEIFFDHGDKILGRPAGLARRGWRPLHRDLEPRLHAVRAGAKDGARQSAAPSIDTGMGLERIAAVLQGTHDNYEIDLFRALIAAIVEETGTGGSGQIQGESHRVIADHLRARPS
jgi:alanyl-tRNA synthetase